MFDRSSGANLPEKNRYLAGTKAKAYKVAERAGIVFLYMGERAVPPPLPGVEATVNYATERARVTYTPGAVTTDDLVRLVTRWHGEGRTVVAVLHDMELVRAHFPDTLLLARRAVAWGPTTTVLTDDNQREARRM